MIDRIINEESLEFENEILNTNNARYIFLYAYFHEIKNKEKFINGIINSDDKKYIHYFFRSVKNIDKELLLDKILSYDDSKYIYYCLYDTKDLEDIYYVKAINYVIDSSDHRYLGLTLYYYFVVMKLYNQDIIERLSSIYSGINKNNYLEMFIKERTEAKEEISEHPKYGFHKYEDRNGYVPDMIVCHISPDYGRIVNTVYNPESRVTTHYVVSRNGEVTHSLDLKDGAWTNGTIDDEERDTYYKFSSNPLVSSRSYNANFYTFTIEHESFDGSLTEEQYQASLKVMCEIIDYVKEKYNKNFIIDKNHIVGHRDVDPIVKPSCPGDKFPFNRFINDLKNIYNN